MTNAPVLAKIGLSMFGGVWVKGAGLDVMGLLH